MLIVHIHLALSEFTSSAMSLSYLLPSPDPCQPNPCPEGSVCTPLMGVVNFTCTCPPRTFNNTTTTQVDCTNRIQYCVLSSPCAGRDVCYNCSCVPGYSGEDCSLKVLDRCDSLSCLNGATCVVSHGGVATCLCAPGYGGSYCDAGVFCSACVQMRIECMC